MSDSIGSLSSNYLQSILTNALQNTGLTTKKTGTSNSLTSIDPASAAQPDNSQLSPFAQLMSTLQQLQQSDPAKYQQVTQQVATNLQSAAQTAQSEGNTTAASQLNQLATDFTNASTNNQLPNVQDLAQAVGAHHHHHSHAASTNTDSSSTSATSGSASQALSQLLSSFQANDTQSTLDPMSIITNTLSSAGVSTSNG